MEQKQTQNGFKDEPCGKPVPDDFAGLCEYVNTLIIATNTVTAAATTTTSVKHVIFAAS